MQVFCELLTNRPNDGCAKPISGLMRYRQKYLLRRVGTAEDGAGRAVDGRACAK
jgi:hypothetical protein